MLLHRECHFNFFGEGWGGLNIIKKTSRGVSGLNFLFKNLTQPP